MFQSYLQEKKKLITAALHEFFIHQKAQSINPWGLDAITRLEEYCGGGKMIRGALVYVGYDLASQNEHSDLIAIASAMELLQAGLLIHDDIMDHDDQRRGKPSVHTQYNRLLLKHTVGNTKDTAKSFAICVGDLAFFYAYELLGNIYHPDISQFVSQNLSRVVQAQMQDVYLGSSQKPITMETILSLYHYKTGYYSISLPMTLGAVLGGATKETIRHLTLFGKNLGIAYQLIDDRLNIFGDPNITGKPIGSDIRERKQTLYLYYLQQEGVDITGKNIQTIKNKIIDLGIGKKMDGLITTYTTAAMEAFQKVPMTGTQKKLIESFVEHLTNRVQ